MITDSRQLEVALHQLAEFKGMLEGITMHLEKTAPSLVPTVSETYHHRIQELQDEICDYLLAQQEKQYAHSVAR